MFASSGFLALHSPSASGLIFRIHGQNNLATPALSDQVVPGMNGLDKPLHPVE
jgi:hypothetical protein